MQSEQTTEWSDADVSAALSNAVAAEAAYEAGEQAPAAATTDAPAGATESQEGTVQAAPAEQNTETFDGGKFNPDELPAELQPAWKQLQAAFTQRTQELAAQRQQVEALGPIEELQQAIDLYSRISDPNNWVQLHTELTQAMQAAGMSLPEAQAAASAAVNEAAQAPAPTPGTPTLDDLDPDVAAALKPVMDQLQRTNAELEAFKQERQTALMNAEAERHFLALQSELQRQENVIRDSHPNWDDEKIEAVYELSSFHGGDLVKAAARLDALLQAERAAYVGQKSAAMTDSTRTPAPNSSGAQTMKVNEPQTLKEAEAEAAEFFAARVASLTE